MTPPAASTPENGLGASEASQWATNPMPRLASTPPARVREAGTIVRTIGLG